MARGYEIRKTIFGKVNVHYPCPKCGERLESPLSDAGTADSCPDCGTRFVVPGADAKQSISRNEQAVREKRTQQSATPPAPTPSPGVTPPPVMRRSSNQVRHEAELSAHEQVRVDGDQHRDDNAALSEYIPNFDPDCWDEEFVEALRCIVEAVNQLRDRVASPNARTFEPMSLNLHWDYLDDDVAALLAQVELAIEQLNSAIEVGVPIPSNEFVFRVDESIIDDDLVFFVRRMQVVLNGLRTRQTPSAIDSQLKHFDSKAKKIRNCVGSPEPETRIASREEYASVAPPPKSSVSSNGDSGESSIRPGFVRTAPETVSSAELSPMQSSHTRAHDLNISWDRVCNDFLARLQSLAGGNDASVKVFRSSGISGLLSYLFAAAAAVTYVICLWNTATWNTFLILVAAGVLITYLFTWVTERAIWHQSIGRDFVMCNPMYFIAVGGSGVAVKPLWRLTDCKTAKIEQRLEMRFYFGNNYLSIPFSAHQAELIAQFASYLLAYRDRNSELLREKPLEQRLASNDWSEWGNADVFSDIAVAPEASSHPLAKHIQPRARRLIAAGVAVPLFLLLVPRVIDYNAFRAAEVVGTATAYRTYLAEQSNVLYREKARTATKALYDKHIQEYSAKAGHSRGATAFVEVIRYLRDRDLYEIPVAFQCGSNVRNLRTPMSRIVPIEPSFTATKNHDREYQVIGRINETLGRFFPTDIVTVEPWEQQDGPKIVVAYTYNNKPDSSYFSESEQYLPEEQRTWYYGIEITWNFAIHVPGRKSPAYTFQLDSEPAPSFTTMSEGANAVYDKMALTAYDDFVDEFNRQFMDTR